MPRAAPAGWCWSAVMRASERASWSARSAIGPRDAGRPAPMGMRSTIRACLRCGPGAGRCGTCRQWLAALDDATSTADAGAQFAMFVAVTDSLLAAAGTRGLLLVLEDMHWADRLSVLLLTHVCSELANSRVGLVISFRPRSPGPLRDGLDRLIRGRAVTHIALEGLTTADIGTWLSEYPPLRGRHQLADNLRERTAGNPLLIRLLVEALVSVPGGADPRDVEADTRAAGGSASAGRLPDRRTEPIGPRDPPGRKCSR